MQLRETHHGIILRHFNGTNLYNIVILCFHLNFYLYLVTLRIDRVAKEDAIVEGVRIPKGAVAVVPLYALHHDPETWPDPEKFNPDRLVHRETVYIILTYFSWAIQE